MYNKDENKILLALVRDRVADDLSTIFQAAADLEALELTLPPWDMGSDGENVRQLLHDLVSDLKKAYHMGTDILP